MPNTQQQDIETLVRLLSEESGPTFQARYADCEAIIARYLEDGSAFLIQLVEAAVEAGVHGITLIDDAVSFLDDADLARLATFLQDAAANGADVEDLLARAALQATELFPDEVLADIPDFEDWQTHADPRVPPACHHLVFGGGTPNDSPLPTHSKHPTWHLKTTGSSFTIGGEGTGLCPACGRRLVHLITLDNFGAEMTPAFPRLRIETCDGSLEPTYYAHDAAGVPTPMAPFHSDYGSSIEPASKKSSVRLAPTPSRWLRQSWGISNSRQNLFRLGGLPSWVQGPQFPLVPGTDREMKFLLQFDSMAGFFWGSGGMLYVFWDEESRITCHVPQCT